MKKIVVLILSWLIAISAFSQEEGAVDSQTTKKLTKEQKMAIRQAEEEVMSRMVDSLVKVKRFVLEADYLSNQTGYRVHVSNLINFIIVDSARITIQIASTTGIGGPNGMGGITTNGYISSFDVKKAGKGRGYYIVRLMAMTSVGSYDIFLNISPSSNTDATISGVTHGKLNYHGVVKPMDKSRVFKAMSI
jgi:hypothetical protein